MIYNLQILRGISLFSVFLFHLAEEWFSFGYLGVPIFFIISGYLMLPQAREISNFQGLIYFLNRRLMRLAPAALFCIFVSAIFVYFFLSYQNFVSFSAEMAAGVLFASNFFYEIAFSDYFSESSKFKFLLHYWSLAVEVQFYLLISALSLLFNAKRYLFWLSIFLSSFIFFIEVSESKKFYYLFWNLHYFSFGIFLRLIASSRDHEGRLINLVSAIILLVVSLFLPHVPFREVILLGATALFICNMNAPNLATLSVLKFLGDRSYSIYLWHMPVFAFARYYFLEIDFFNDYFILCLVLLVTVALSEFSFRVIERIKWRFSISYFLRFLRLYMALCGIFVAPYLGYHFGLMDMTFKDFSLVRRFEYQERNLARGGLGSDDAPHVAIVGDSIAKDLTLALTFIGIPSRYYRLDGDCFIHGGVSCLNEFRNFGLETSGAKIVILNTEFSTEGDLGAHIEFVQSLKSSFEIPIYMFGTFRIFDPDTLLRRYETRDGVNFNARRLLSDDLLAHDEMLKIALGESYFSKIDLFCNALECDIYSLEGINFFDEVHLTDMGIEQFGRMLISAGFQEKGW